MRTTGAGGDRGEYAGVLGLKMWQSLRRPGAYLSSISLTRALLETISIATWVSSASNALKSPSLNAKFGGFQGFTFRGV